MRELQRMSMFSVSQYRLNQSIQPGMCVQKIILVTLSVLLLGSGCQAQASAGPLPWSEQLEHLQSRAHREDPDAVLSTCFASVMDDPYKESVDLSDLHTLDIMCFWSVPQDKTIRIDYSDHAMKQTLDMRREFESMSPSSTLQALARAQATIPLGPRDVLAIVQPHSKQFLTRENTIISINIALWTATPKNTEYAVPVIWQVAHTSLDGTAQYLYVSAIDGSILEEKWEETLQDVQTVP